MGAGRWGGHLAEVLVNNNHRVIATDIVNRNYPGTEVVDFLAAKAKTFNGDIITNPPYKYAQEFIEKALDCIPTGNKVAMLLKLTFLEGKRRKSFYEKNPPIRVYVLSERKNCYKNGDFSVKGSGAVAYAWFVWQKGYKGDPSIKWL